MFVCRPVKGGCLYCVCTCVCVPMNVCAYMYACANGLVCLCVCLCMCMCLCVCIHAHCVCAYVTPHYLYDTNPMNFHVQAHISLRHFPRGRAAISTKPKDIRASARASARALVLCGQDMGTLLTLRVSLFHTGSMQTDLLRPEGAGDS